MQSKNNTLPTKPAALSEREMEKLTDILDKMDGDCCGGGACGGSGNCAGNCGQTGGSGGCGGNCGC